MSEPERYGFTITQLARVSAHLVIHDWAWARENGAWIARNWERHLGERRGLFDGIVLLSCRCTIEDGVCHSKFFETRFSNFIGFRDAGSPEEAVANAFSAIVPHTADGAVLLGQMGPHTVNAGKIYFPCGTPDHEDVREGGIVDLADSAVREFQEETGLAVPGSAEDAPWVLLRGDGQHAFLRPVRFEATAGELIARGEAYRAGEEQPELARLVVARSRADIDPSRMTGFACAYLETVFER